MAEESKITVAAAPLEHTRGRALTCSPPTFKHRSSSVPDSDEEYKKQDFHQRNLDHIRKLAERKVQRMHQIQEEQRKLEATRERLSRLVLSRVQKAKEAKEEEKDSKEPLPPVTDAAQPDEYDTVKTEGGEGGKKTQLKAFYRSRYSSLLKTLQENNRLKQKQEEMERQKQVMKQQKLKEELGLVNVVSKLHYPTIASLLNSIATKDEDLGQLKQPSKPSLKQASLKPRPEADDPRPDDDKEKQRLAREAADKIRKRADDYLQQITDKRQAEARKEQEAKEKAARLLTAAREAVLSRKKQLEIPKRTKSASPEGSEVDEETVAKRKTIDKDALQKLAQHRRNNAPMITDFVQWKKRNRVSEGDRVFIQAWVENTEKHSPCFDFKWTLKVKDIDFRSLADYQIVNHFEKNSKITTKVGLSHSLRNLIWFNNVDIDTFFPRCFDVSDQAELEDLVTEIKAVKAESVLRRASSGIKTPTKLLQVALGVCQRRIKDLDDLIDDPNIHNFILVTDKEWEILAADEMNAEDLQRKKHEEWLQRNEMSPKRERESEGAQERVSEGHEDSVMVEVNAVLSQMKERFPQFDLNGHRNAWIVKPAGLSRGRGIACFNTLVQILDYLRKEGQWIVQKYIENPLLILNKKFDIRQWVLVTDFNPLTIWFYENCYLRFGVEDFDISDLQNRFIHLTNNSVVKHSEKFYETEIEGSMWHSEEFAEYLVEQTGRNYWEETIKPRIKDIVKWSLESAQDMIEHRKNSSELFGYDVMIDSNLTPWLIEINSSPAMDYSTQVTKKLVKEVMEDCVKVLVDYGYASAKKKPSVNTGNFTMIYKAKRMVEQPQQAFGLNLVCQGKPLK